jgi:hypothetical protein
LCGKTDISTKKAFNDITKITNNDKKLLSEGCGWCGKAVDENTGLSSAAATFCSELCFSQSRRANFKKNKTCDWCRHVRHTVSYVDSQVDSFLVAENYLIEFFCRTDLHNFNSVQTNA